MFERGEDYSDLKLKSRGNGANKKWHLIGMFWIREQPE